MLHFIKGKSIQSGSAMGGCAGENLIQKTVNWREQQSFLDASQK